MYISRIFIKNFRNFDEFDLFIPDGSPLTIIGGNNVGKTNLLHALRLVLDSNIAHWEKGLSENDFCWTKENCWQQGEEIVITVTFSSVANKEEIKSFLYSIAPEESGGADDDLEANLSFIFAPSQTNKGQEYDIDEDYVAFLVAGRYHPSGYSYDAEGIRQDYSSHIIESLHACSSAEDFYKFFYLDLSDIEKIRDNKSISLQKKLGKQVYVNKIRKHINLLYLDALRDVKNDFHQGYNSLVSQLIRSLVKSNDNHKISQEITDAFKAIRTGNTIPQTNKVLEKIEDRLQNDEVNLLANKANLTISTPSITLDNVGRYFNFLVNLDEDLKKSLEMKTIGLGYQNLAYISAIFALFEFKKELSNEKSEEKEVIVFNLLLIEEPEAHLDVQNQKFLHTQIESKTEMLASVLNRGDKQKDFSAFTQVLQTSHSTHLASKSDLQNIVVVQKESRKTRAVNIDAALKLDSEKYTHNKRILKQYLDATRSAFLFARKVVLVEGLSEKYVIGTILNTYLKKVSGKNILDIDSEGIEIVEVGGKNFGPFTTLFNSDASRTLHNKCLVLHDGDFQMDKKIDYSQLYEDLNKQNQVGKSNVLSKTNIFTFEIDSFFIPNPNDVTLDNLEYLKLILFRFWKDGHYFTNLETLKKKFELIDDLNTKIKSGALVNKEIVSFFKEVLRHEVSKPTLALYLASLLKAKLLEDPRDIVTWIGAVKEGEGNHAFVINGFEKLPPFIIPKYIEEGIVWLTSE